MIDQIVDCESGGNHSAVGDGGKARGITQYHKATFYYHAKLSGFSNADWMNEEHQLKLLRWCLEKGNCGKEWTCYRKLYIY